MNIIDHPHFRKLTEKEFKEAPSEIAKYRSLVVKYLLRDDGLPACVLDIATQGDPACPWSIGFDLPVDEFNYYCSNHPAKGPIQMRGHADKLPFENESFESLISSHLLEDYLDWEPVVREWLRVLRPNGYLIILIPDKELWEKAIEAGQNPNCSHRHEGKVGELSELATRLGLEIIEDRLTDQHPGDYSILGVFRKIKGGW
jgi:SAM-dependent methyltransferase